MEEKLSDQALEDYYHMLCNYFMSVSEKNQSNEVKKLISEKKTSELASVLARENLDEKI
jgi:hypothetical protein